jgi:N-acetylglutamate synthase-like GNAT family acetyltransferase
MNPGAVTLRKASPVDARFIRKMVREANIFPFALDWRRFLLAVDGEGTIAGCIQVKPHGDGTREMASLVVVPARQGAGIARVMIEAVQAGNERPLYLTCRGALQPLYRKFGFRTLKTAQMPPYYRRLRRLFEILRFVLRLNEELAVMVWD